MRVIYSLVIALATYSRVPVPQVPWNDENRRYTMAFFPVIGLIVGGLIWLWLILCRRLGAGALMQGAVGAVIPLLVTGGIHMDGFMDTSDALGSWQPKEKKLEILKDSHVGAFAVMACAGYMLLMAAALGQATAAQGPLIGMGFVLSRAMSAWAMAAFKSARPGGMLDGFARAAHRRLVSVTSGLWAAACAAVWALCGGWTALWCALAAAALMAYFYRMAMKQFGGVTGDLAGWLSQCAELTVAWVVVISGLIGGTIG